MIAMVAYLGFPIKIILAIFDLQYIPVLPTKFKIDWSFVLGEEAKNRFSSIGRINLSIWINYNKIQTTVISKKSDVRSNFSDNVIYVK